MSRQREDRRGRSIKMPPTRLGRLLIALRESVGRRALAPDADKNFLAKVRRHKPERLTRKQAADWVRDIAGYGVTEKDIGRVETGARVTHMGGALKALLTTYGLSPVEVQKVLDDPNLNSLGGANPHLLA